MHTSHYKNATLLHELADMLPQVLSGQTLPDKVEQLQHMAADELDKTQYDEWVRQKITTGRADNRPALTLEDAKQYLRQRFAHVRGRVKCTDT